MINILVKNNKKAIYKIEDIIMEIGDGFVPTASVEGDYIRITHDNCNEEKFLAAIRENGLEEYLV